REAPGSESLDSLLADWKDNRSLSFAADLVGAALVDGTPERAHDAAQFILDLGNEAPTSATALARSVLGLRSQEAPEVLQSPDAQTAIIGRLKAQLREAPRNPTVWVDLARAYTLRGQTEPAVRAMRAALGLAPGNRFVLR